MERYQRHSIEWNQALGLRVIRGKNFKDTAQQFRTSPSTVIRRFDSISSPMFREVDELPEVIAIDEYKGDTNKGKYQVMIANGKTGEPLDILPDRSVDTVKHNLSEKGGNVKMVVMDMSYLFKSAVKKNSWSTNHYSGPIPFLSLYLLGFRSFQEKSSEKLP